MSREQSKHTILIAGIGISPAVLTETVWALAHQKKPVVPDEIARRSWCGGKWYNMSTLTECVRYDN